MKKLILCYVGKAKDFNQKSTFRYTLRKIENKCFKLVKGD